MGRILQPKIVKSWIGSLQLDRPLHPPHPPILRWESEGKKCGDLSGIYGTFFYNKYHADHMFLSPCRAPEATQTVHDGWSLSLRERSPPDQSYVALPPGEETHPKTETTSPVARMPVTH